MEAITRQFNLFLALMALAMLCGCQTEKKNKEVRYKKEMENKELGIWDEEG